jgi:hypothetical protein
VDETPIGERTADLIEITLQWPFGFFESCYWSSQELMYRSEDEEVSLSLPMIFGVSWDTPGMEYVQEVLMNVMFNMGFIYQDIKFLIELTPADSNNDWFYRNAFVIGDIYMRLFYRSLASAPLELIS